METFDAWFDRTLTESDVAIGITDPALARRLVTLLEATSTSTSTSPGSRAPAQLDAA